MKNNVLKFLAVVLIGVGVSIAPVQAQDISTGSLDGRVNTVFTAIPFLRITPDARAGGMGDVGLATSADAASLYHNASKLAFIENDFGASISYTPWLRELVDDIFIGYVSGYKRIDDMQTLGLSLRYFSLGKIQFTNINAEFAGEANPNEFAIDFAYSRKLSEKFSAGLTLKYIYSNLAKGQSVNGSTIKAANAFAADLSFYFQNDPISIGNGEATISAGLAISNIGNKVSYTDKDVKDFLPGNFGFGAAFIYDIDDYNRISLYTDINKILAPTPDPSDTTGAYRSKSLLSGMFGSFGDAPGGFKEEMQELMYSFGIEYWYNKQFAVRAGHFNEHRLKGNRKYITLGVGLRYKVMGLNFSYLIPTTDIRNHPLENTLRFSLLFNMGEVD